MNQKQRALRERLETDIQNAMIVAAAKNAVGTADDTVAMIQLRDAVQVAQYRKDEIADDLLRHYTIRERVRK